MEELTQWALEQAISRVKIKIGESGGTLPSRDGARMRQARTVIGNDVELFVDANGGYSAKQAIRVMAEVRELNIRWLEEPVSSDDLSGLREVWDRVDTDVQTDGCLDPRRGTLRPSTAPGNGLSLRTPDMARYRIG